MPDIGAIAHHASRGLEASARVGASKLALRVFDFDAVPAHLREAGDAAGIAL